MATLLLDGTLTTVGPVSIVQPSNSANAKSSRATLTTVGPVSIMKHDTGLATMKIAVADGSLADTCYIPAGTLRGVLRRAAVMPRIRAAAIAGRPWKMERIYQLLLGQDKESEQRVESIDLEAIRKLRDSDPALALFGCGLVVKSSLEVAHALPDTPVAPIKVHGSRKDLNDDPEVLELMQEAELAQWAQRAGATSRRARLGTQRKTLQLVFGKATDAERAALSERIAALDAQAEAETALMAGMGNTTRMLFDYAAMPPGVACRHSIRINDDRPDKSGQLLAALDALSLAPVIGGQRARGAGQIACEYEVKRIADGKATPLGNLRIGGFAPMDFAPADAAGDAWKSTATQKWAEFLAQESEV